MPSSLPLGYIVRLEMKLQCPAVAGSTSVKSCKIFFSIPAWMKCQFTLSRLVDKQFTKKKNLSKVLCLMVRSCQAKEIFLQIWPSNDHTEKYSANSLYTEQSWMVRLCKVSWLQTLDYGSESTKVVYMA